MSRTMRPVGPDDRRRVQPPSDAQRLLGQIERGEVHAGAEAARKIAARSEEQYGAAFRGTPTEALRRQMRAAAVEGGTTR